MYTLLYVEQPAYTQFSFTEPACIRTFTLLNLRTDL